MALDLRYPSLVKFGELELTDESRGPLSESRDERSIVVELANGKKRKFIKGIDRKWSVSWDNVAMNASNTVDGKAGRNEIRNLAQSGDVYTLTIQDGRNTPETYSVFITDYSDDVVMRHGEGDLFRYKLSLGFEMQG